MKLGIVLFLFVLLVITGGCSNNDKKSETAMFIIVNKYEDFEEEKVEITREGIDEFSLIEDPGFEYDEASDTFSDIPEYSKQEIELFEYLKNSSAFYTSDTILIDSIINVLTKEKVGYELLCGYDMELYIAKHDTIIKHYRINSACNFMYTYSEGYLFDNLQFFEQLKKLNKIDMTAILFCYETKYGVDSTAYEIKTSIKMNEEAL